MDREQEEMQFLGLWGIYTEAYKIIISWRKIFSQITLALILPLSFIFLMVDELFDLLLRKITEIIVDFLMVDELFDLLLRKITEIIVDDTQPGTRIHDKFSDLTSEKTMFWLFKAAYLIFSLLSTSAVVYTIACIYTTREVTFKKVMSVVPKVWKRLMVTFLCEFVDFLCYNVVAILTIGVCALVFGPMTTYAKLIIYLLLILYLVGFVYLSIIWQLARTVSVLEEVYGWKAMIKSKALLKGKMWAATIIFLKLNFSILIIQFAFGKLVVHGESLGMVNRVCYGIVFFLLLIKLFLFVLVIQTVIYFVCKSYHQENIDKSILPDHLEVYLGDYVPLKTEDVQLEYFDV